MVQEGVRLSLFDWLRCLCLLRTINKSFGGAFGQARNFAPTKCPIFEQESSPGLRASGVNLEKQLQVMIIALGKRESREERPRWINDVSIVAIRGSIK